MAENKFYPVYCGWCASKGQKTLVRWSDKENSTGICPACLEEQNRLLEEMGEETGQEGNEKWN